ncbi:hypothetical protein GCM10023091_33820 [Ravibacter arvi]|uniref:Uncharacterized protein n=1 Tax=Ravibacter arvi TaxID=2051041 RepID=A0ABP8M636_9BACT
MNNDFIRRLKSIKEKEELKTKRNEFLKTAYKYPLFTSLCDTLKYKVDILKENGFKKIRAKFGSINSEYDMPLVDPNLNAKGCLLTLDGCTSLGLMYTNKYYQDLDDNDYEEYSDDRGWLESFRICCLQCDNSLSQITLPTNDPVILTVNDNLEPLWNGLSNDEMTDLIILTLIEYLEQDLSPN